ncbi:MAG: hypothetical protein J2P20_02980 [Pseudonocardia sp.]|nr:hypothetical protein [Pseudonocardia sp.]MBO0875094.1 hypothetical protein [Pseudonocardia sp.]
MSDRRSMRPHQGTWPSELRLEAWRPASAEDLGTGEMLGSLRGVLIDFVPAMAGTTVPVQRTHPEVAARLRGRR